MVKVELRIGNKIVHTQTGVVGDVKLDISKDEILLKTITNDLRNIMRREPCPDCTREDAKCIQRINIIELYEKYKERLRKLRKCKT